MIEPSAYADRVAPLAPHGAALLAWHRGDHDAGTRVRSTLGEDEVLPAGIFFRAGPDLFPWERYALELARGNVLDLGAGTGVHSLELRARGLEVFAVENQPDLARILRERGVERIERADFRIWAGARGDTVLMLMNGLGPAGTLAGLDRFLRHVHALVSPGGQLLVDIAEALPEPGPPPDGLPPRGAYAGEAWIELAFDGNVGRPFRELYLDYETLARHAHEAGWAAAVAFEGDGGSFLVRLTAA